MVDSMELVYDYIYKDSSIELYELLQTFTKTELKTFIVIYQESSPLSIACQYNSVKVVHLFLSAYTMDVNRLHKKHGEEISLLFIAIRYGSAETVELLVRYGADTQWKDKSGRNALVYACLTERHAIADILSNYGASINCLKNNAMCAENVVYLERALDKTDINYCDCFGNTILIQAVKERRFPALDMLRRLMPDKYIRNGNGSNALDIAVAYYDESMIWYLLRNFYLYVDYIDSLELFGARCILQGYISKGLSCWINATNACKIHNCKRSLVVCLTWKHAPNTLKEFNGPLDASKLTNARDSYLQALNVFLRHVPLSNASIRDAIKKTALVHCMDLKNSFGLLHMLFKTHFFNKDIDRIVSTAMKSVCFLCEKYIKYDKTTTLETRMSLLKLLVSFITKDVWGYLEIERYVDSLMDLYKNMLDTVLQCVEFIKADYYLASSEAATLLEVIVHKQLQKYPTSLLHIAAEKNYSFEMFSILRRCDPIINCVDKKDDLPLHVLIKSPHTNPNRFKIAAYLIAAGSDIDKENAGVIPREYFLSLKE